MQLSQSDLDYVSAIRVEKARADFNEFVEFVGIDHEGRPIRQAELHRLMWDFEAWCYRVGLYCGMMIPMGHGKTTQCELRTSFEIGKNTSTIAAFVKASDKAAGLSAGAVRATMDLPRYQAVFSSVEIVKGEQSDTEFTLRRAGVSPWPTLGCYGVTTGTGARTTFQIMDDVVDLRNAITQPADRRRVTEAIESTWMSRPTQTGEFPPRVVWINTAYHVEDAVHLTMARRNSGWAWLVVRAEPPYAHLTYQIIAGGRVLQAGTLPNFLSQERLASMAGKMNSISAARGLGNRPLSGKEQKFKDLLTGPKPLGINEYTRRVAHMDPAGDAKKAKRGDPDWSAIVAMGRHPSEPCWDVIRSTRMRGTSSQQADFAAECADHWGLHLLVVEAVADSSMSELVKEACRRRGVTCIIETTRPMSNKIVRIEEELEPRLRQQVVRIHADSHPELAAELDIFPLGGHDDMADACAGAAQAAVGRGIARHKRREDLPKERKKPRRARRRRRIWEHGLFAGLG